MTEKDPLGKSQHEPGSKLDAGKLKPRLILQDMPRAIVAVVEVATYGADKYTEQGWVSVPAAEKRYTDAMLRHFLAMSSGESLDRESGLSHLAHMAWNSLALLELQKRKESNA